MNIPQIFGTAASICVCLVSSKALAQESFPATVICADETFDGRNLPDRNFYSDPFLVKSRSDLEEAARQYTKIISERFGNGRTLYASCFNASQFAKLRNSEYIPFTFTMKTANSTASSGNKDGDNGDKGSRSVSCVYIVDYQDRRYQDKFYVSNTFHAKTTPQLYWNNIYTSWGNFIEHNYDTTDGGAITSHQCVEAATDQLLVSKRAQMVSSARNGNSRTRINVVWDGE